MRTDGYVGCSDDVMSELQSACSGQQSCQVQVDDTTFSRATACPSELESYLSVMYRCTTGNTNDTAFTRVTPSHTVISNFTSLFSGGSRIVLSGVRFLAPKI